MLDIQRRVDVAVVVCIAGGAIPRPGIQWHGFHLVLTHVARFGAGKPLINSDEVLALFPGLVFQLGVQGVPRRIADMFGELGILHHISDFQCLVAAWLNAGLAALYLQPGA